MSRKVWAVNEILASADVNSYLMDQSVMSFAGTAARSSAIATATEGMVTYLEDVAGVQAFEYYNGSAWTQLIPPAGAINNITAAYTVTATDVNDTIVAGGTVAYTITVPDLLAIGDRVDIVRDSSGTVTLAAGTGVTTWAGAGTAGTAVAFKMDQQYNAATVFKVASNSYRVIGKITT